MAPQHAVELADLRRKPEGVPHVAVPREGSQGLRPAVSADQDREPLLDRHRVDRHAVEGVVAARRRGHALARHERPDGADRLVEPVESLPGTAPEFDPELTMLELEPRAADAEDRPPSRRVIESGHDLCHEGRVAERVRPDHEADLYPLGGHRPGRDRGPALEDGLVRVPEDRLDVIPRPEVLVAQTVDRLCRVEQLIPGGSLAPEVDADLEVVHGGLPRLSRNGRRLATRR